jgi:predicted MPP superfamily phosphohydrolase
MNNYALFFAFLILPWSFTNSALRNSQLPVGILVFGDFGTGTEEQRMVAEKMISYCHKKNCDFAVTTGDNIYKKGIENNANGTPNYTNIIDRFVKLYQELNMPIYLSLGNHDINLKAGQQGVLSGIKNAVDFTQHPLNPLLSNNKKKNFRLYNMDNSYYSKREDSNINLYALDTNNFPSSSYKNGLPDKDNMAQLEWLKHELKQEDSKNWTIVFGHMPILSHGIHGNKDALEISEFRNMLLNILCENKVDFYLSGHDHHLEINKFVCKSNKHVVVSIISGAAGIPDKEILGTISENDQNLLWINGSYYEKHRKFVQPYPQNGFVYLELMSDSIAHINLIQLGQTNLKNGYFIYLKSKNIIKIP